MEALQAVKDMFPRMSNNELMDPVDNVVFSTDKNQLMLLKQKHRMLMNTLRQLEVPTITCREHHCSSSVAYVILNMKPLGIFFN
ncbi:hypothetical protein T459_23102 [Capsicum annuum]|uniref:Uncharacterized protein n=1 Tax=Capsicum annuum TaxID=4072 RepID=A0A2G2YRD9_CAPAN|nr:hypothetical protein T459_23102 [Capsicum annuum]